jgi:hypothetical protein
LNPLSSPLPRYYFLLLLHRHNPHYPLETVSNELTVCTDLAAKIIQKNLKLNVPNDEKGRERENHSQPVRARETEAVAVELL